MAEAIDNPFESGAAPAAAAPSDDPFAAPQANTAAPQQANTAPTPDTSFLGAVKSHINSDIETGKGVVKGLGDTVHTVSNLVNKIPVVGETLAPKAGVEALDQSTKSSNTQQTIGKVGEGLAEFFLGDEALKGMSLAEKAGLLSKVAKLSESHPVVAKILGHGLTAVRGGAATAGEELAKGASPKEAAVAGATAAGLGTAAGAAAEGAGAIGSKLIASDALKKTAKGVVPEVSSTIHNVLDDVAKTSGIPVSQEATASKKALEVSAGIKAQAQQTYQQLDKLSGGTYQRFRDTIQDMKEAIAANAHVNPDAAETYRERLKVAEAAYADTQKQLVAQGVDPKVLKQADAQWAQAKSLEDVAKKLRSAEMLSGEMKPGTAQLDTGLKNLKPGRLERAVGTGGADTMRQQVIQSGKDIQSAKADLEAIKNRQKTLKTVAKVAGIGGGIYGVGSAVKSVLGGH